MAHEDAIGTIIKADLPQLYLPACLIRLIGMIIVSSHYGQKRQEKPKRHPQAVRWPLAGQTTFTLR